MAIRKTEYEVIPLLKKYINKIKKGQHLQKNGKKLRPGSIQNYQYLEKLLSNYCELKKFNLRVKSISILNKREFEIEKRYWKRFYIRFTEFLYNEKNHSDNYVGSNIKLFRAFFNYLNNEEGLNIGSFHKNFYVVSEEVEIMVLSPERLNFLIYAEDFEIELDPYLQKIKDIFVFGCAVALRYSDLDKLTKSNLENINNRLYLKVQSTKTNTFTRIKLPEYAVKLLHKYDGNLKSKRILPHISKALLNKKIKELMEKAGFIEPVIKTRRKRGVPRKKSKNTKTQYRFCDLITTHTMRRTAITTMLSLGMNEQMVRKISGHAPNSKEFYRYVNFAQYYLDNELDLVQTRLKKRQLDLTKNSSKSTV